MSERVQCAECERQYDSDEHPFCPRCGATAKTDPVTSARNLASKSDPRRRRVQMAGVIMLSTGALVLLAGIFMLASAGSVWQYASDIDDEAAASLAQTASTIEVTVFQDGTVVEGAQVTLESGQMEFIATHATDANGVARFEDITSFVVDLHIAHGDVDWSTEFIAVNPTQEEGRPLEIHFELADQTITNGPLMGEEMVASATRIMGVGAVLLGVTPVIGGIAAIRLKNQNLAFFGALVGGMPWLFLFVASMSLPILFVMALFVMAVVFVRQGRDLFA